MDVLDVGCGSGILSIAAAKLGARSVFGLEIDSVAIGVAKQNIRENGVGTERPRHPGESTPSRSIGARV